MPSVLIPMADYGHDPTEVATPYTTFKNAGFTIDIATETGAVPCLDKMMLESTTGMLLGANADVKKVCATLMEEPCFRKPLSWTADTFDMDKYDLVFLPGGHEKGVRQLIDSKKMHGFLADYFPKTQRGKGGGKTVAAICHGVQVLAFTPSPTSHNTTFPVADDGTIHPKSDFQSIIHSCKTTALPAHLESFITNATRLFLGDYYKTYGFGTPNVEDYVRLGLDCPEKQFQSGPAWYSPWLGRPVVVVDEAFRYLSGRFPPDAEKLAEMAVEEVREALDTRTPDARL